MIKHAIAAVSVASLVLSPAVTAQITKYGVTVTAEKNVDFSTFKTYSWTPGRGAFVVVARAVRPLAVDHSVRVAAPVSPAPAMYVTTPPRELARTGA